MPQELQLCCIATTAGDTCRLPSGTVQACTGAVRVMGLAGLQYFVRSMLLVIDQSEMYINRWPGHTTCSAVNLSTGNFSCMFSPMYIHAFCLQINVYHWPAHQWLRLGLQQTYFACCLLLYSTCVVRAWPSSDLPEATKRWGGLVVHAGLASGT
jgi:hypothetical protein